ncbi:MAG TPA: HIT family protein [Streptosporangiaceae bacterium]
MPPIASTCRCPSAATGKRYRAKVSDCIFCAIAAGETAAHLVRTDDQTVAFLDARPVFKGHVLVIPRAHHATLADLPDDLLEPFFGAVRLISAALPAALGAQGTFVAVNNVVSQSVPHLHGHVVPRTKGDGLRGFFWPRHRYADDAEATAYASRIRAALEQEPGA